MTSGLETEKKAERALTRADYDRFLPFVRRIAIRLARRVPSHITVADLVSYGWVGLLEAYSRANPDMPPNEFEAYAQYRVKGAMLDYLRSLDPITRETRNASRRVTRAIADLTGKLGRPPEEVEIAAHLGMTEDAYHDLLNVIADAGMARLELIDLDQLDIESPDDQPDEGAGRKMLSDAVAEAIEKLPLRLQQVLALYYMEGCTLAELGGVLGVTESRASQLHTEAMHRIRALIGRE